jgi:hypothetical protein
METQNVSGEASTAPTAGHLHGEAPKITPAIIEQQIIHEAYFTAYDGVAGANRPSYSASEVPESLSLLTFCVLTLRNGFTVVGKSACASPANFNPEIGRQVARGDAVRQVWPLLGYELRSALHMAEKFGDNELGEALTRMVAHRLGNQEAFRAEDSDIIVNHFQRENGEGMHA